MATGLMKKCPYCAQLIPLEALVCHLCRRDVETSEGVIALEDQALKDQKALEDQALKDQKNQKRRKLIRDTSILAIILFILWWAASNKPPTVSNTVVGESPSTPTTQSSAQTSNAAKQRLQMLYGMEEGAAAYEQIRKAADRSGAPIDSFVDNVIKMKDILDRDRAVENRAQQGPAIYRYFGPGSAQPITGLTLPECLAQAKGNAGLCSK